MKVLLACEGQSEVALINSLIELGYMHFEYPLLLDEPVRVRQLTDIAPVINALPIDEDIVIYRIGDTQKDSFNLSKFPLRTEHIFLHKVCTKREIEILVIINEGWYDEFLKCSRNTKPKSFVRSRMPSFDPNTYFFEHDMVAAIIEYKRIKKHAKDELYLADLLRLG